MIEGFKERIATELKARPQLANSYTLMHEGQWNTAFAHAEDGTRRLITQRDLDDFRTGTVRIFVVIRIPYKDNAEWHNLRTGQYLVPPATVPAIWHFCDYFTDSD